jgi:hypothetical protein
LAKYGFNKHFFEGTYTNIAFQVENTAIYMGIYDKSFRNSKPYNGVALNLPGHLLSKAQKPEPVRLKRLL